MTAGSNLGGISFDIEVLRSNLDTSKEDEKIEKDIKRLSTLDFELSYEQIKAITKIIKFINSKGPNKEIVLCGNPGTGKTAVLSQVIAYLNNKHYDYVACAPTHKARLNLEKMTKSETLTLHQLLQLRPNLEIPELDLNGLKFLCGLTKDRKSHIPRLIVIDECSMITADLYKYIKEELIAKRGVKLIFIGDSKQLSGINESDISDVFKVNNKIELTKIYRQADEAPLLHLLKDLREEPHYGRFKEFESEYGSLKNYDNPKEFLREIALGYKKAIQENNPDYIKVITYTNGRIESYNSVLHKILSKSSEDYSVGEFVMGYDNFDYSKASLTSKTYEKKIINSLDYRVKQVVKYTLPESEIFPYPLDGYLLDLHDYIYDDPEDWNKSDLTEDCKRPWEYLFILPKDMNPRLLNAYIQKLEQTRLRAVKTDKSSPLYSTLWRQYFQLNSYVATPVDLFYEGRLVKSATLKLGYAMSTHKSQGSSIDNIFLDYGDLKRCRESETFRQLEYVALSRARNNVHVLN